jgi:hypothetical protein
MVSVFRRYKALVLAPLPGVTGTGVKRPGSEADHSPTRAEVKKNVDLYIYSPICLHGVVLNWLSSRIILPLLVLCHVEMGIENVSTSRRKNSKLFL